MGQSKLRKKIVVQKKDQNIISLLLLNFTYHINQNLLFDIVM